MTGWSRATQTSRLLLISGTLAVSWLGMQPVHELGHVLGAVATGGRVTRVELRPWSLSRTDVDPNPHPLFERWAGPVVGSLLPVCVWLAGAAARLPWSYLLRFFAGFCLVANGAYLGAGALWPAGDAADILGSHPARWPLWSFGVVALAGGLALWHRLGPWFGLGRGARPVSLRHAVGCWGVAAAIVAAELLW